MGNRKIKGTDLIKPQFLSTHLVVLEHSQLDLLLLVLVLLGGGVVLLLALLGATTETQHQVESGLLLDVVVGQGAPILQLLASKDQTLLVRGDACKQIMNNLRLYKKSQMILVIDIFCIVCEPVL